MSMQINSRIAKIPHRGATNPQKVAISSKNPQKSAAARTRPNLGSFSSVWVGQVSGTFRADPSKNVPPAGGKAKNRQKF